MKVVYKLIDDVERIRSIQKATLDTEEFGLQQTHGLFGSNEWWQKIRNGELTLHTKRGVITKVYMGSMRDWPSFQMEDENGEVSNWTRELNRAEDDKFYSEGKVIEIDYVLQKFKDKAWDGPRENENVIEIRIET